MWKTRTPTQADIGARIRAGAVVIMTGLFASGCATRVERSMKVTAYCDCPRCCNWERGTDGRLHLDFWRRQVASGARAGQPYSGRTASGARPRQYEPGLFSVDTLTRPWMAPVRLLLVWKILPRDGSMAVDTEYYPFGVRMYVPGYGWAVAQDRGSAIRGPDRIDVFFNSHSRALRWGQRTVNVSIVQPREN